MYAVDLKLVRIPPAQPKNRNPILWVSVFYLNQRDFSIFPIRMHSMPSACRFITIKKQANTKERRRTNIKPSFDDKQKSTLKIIDSSIASCEKVRGKLKEGSSQLSLNTNRLQALYLAKEILQNTDSQQIEQALIQITSIRRKSETGLAHAKSGSATYTRFRRLVEAMDVVLQGLETAKKKKDKL